MSAFSRFDSMTFSASLCAFLFFALSSTASAQNCTPETVDDAAVVFVGHSLVNYDMPQMFRQIAVDDAKTVQTADHVFNGAPIRYNWENRFEHLFTGEWPPAAFAGDALNTGQYDVLVMTEGIPLENQIIWNESSLYARLFLDLARSNNAQTRVYLYETWHSLNEANWLDRIVTDRALWEQIVDEVNQAQSGQDMFLIPAGTALRELVIAMESGQVPGLTNRNQLFVDDIHMNDMGNYFIACVMHAAIYKTSPVGLRHQTTNLWGGNYTAPSAAVAAIMQQIAWDVVRNETRSGICEDSNGGGNPCEGLAQASAGPDQSVCSSSVTLAGNVPTSGTGTWTITSVVPIGAGLPSNPGGESFANATSATTSFTGNRGYSYTLTWTHDTPDCSSSSDTVVINLNSAPSTANAGADRSICLSTGINLDAVAPVSGVGTWSITAAPQGSNPVFDAPNSASSGFSTDMAGTYQFTWTVSNGECGQNSDTVTYQLAEVDISTTGSFPQGINPVTLIATTSCVSESADLEWTNDQTGASYGVGVNPVTLPDLLTETTTFTVSLVDANRAATFLETITVLVGDTPDIADPSGDGCNNMEDLMIVAAEWLLPTMIYDADGNQVLDIRDLAFINTADEGTACDNP
jgi:hypothetical protein